MRVELGEELRRARSARGLSLDSASRGAKISQGYLHKLEAGRVENPSPRVLHRLAEVLEVPYTRLMRLADYLMPSEADNRKEVAVTSTKSAAPTNAELLRALEAVRGELEDLKRAQRQLVVAVDKIAAGRPRAD